MRCCLHSFTSSAMTMFDIGRLALNVSDCKKHLLPSLGLSLLCSFVLTFTIVVLVWRVQYYTSAIMIIPVVLWALHVYQNSLLLKIFALLYL